MEKDTAYIQAVCAHLGDFGLCATPLPRRQHSKTPDILVEHDHERVVIEVKDKQEDPGRLLEESKTLVRGGIYSFSESANQMNRISSRIKEGTRQLRAWQHADFRVLWFRVSGKFADLRAIQIGASLYGIRQLINRKPGGEARDCYYFAHSDFIKWRSCLDAVVIHRDDTGSAYILPNSSSEQYDRLLGSCLCRAFGSAVWLPETMERRREIFLVPPGERLGLGNGEELIRYLNRRYGADLIPVDLRFHSGWIQAGTDSWRL